MTPGMIIGGAQALLGGIQSLVGGGKARQAQRELENLQTPTTNFDQGIADYYDQAKNPYNSLEYQLQKQNTGANLATGLSAFQDRRAGLAGIGGLIRQRNNSLLAAAANAQSRLGQATQMNAAEKQRVWNVNTLMPYNKKFSLLAAKAGANAQTANAGLSNIFGGLNTLAMGYAGKKAAGLDGIGGY